MKIISICNILSLKSVCCDIIVLRQILRRSGPDEKVLCLIRQRPGHRCATAVIVVAVVLWDALDASLTDHCYRYLSDVLPTEGIETDRRCGLNQQ